MKTRILHIGLAVFWVLMVIPTVTLWQSSILLVLLMSLFANIEASFSAAFAAKSNEDSVEKRPRIRSSKYTPPAYSRRLRNKGTYYSKRYM